MLLNYKNSSVWFSVILVVSAIKICRGNKSHNGTRRAHVMEEKILNSFQRLPRILSFKTLDEDLKVDLEFTVPFMNFPVKRSHEAMTSLSKSVANINMAAIVLTGIVVLAGISISTAFSAFSKSTLSNFKTASGRRETTHNILENLAFGYRSSNGSKAEMSLWDMFEDFEDILHKHDIDMISCVQKSVCSIVQRSSENVLTGIGSSFDKIVDGLSSSNWILKTISGTAIKDAVDAGRNDLSCISKYKQCRFKDNEIIELMNFV